MQEHERTTGEEKLVLSARLGSVEGAAEEGAGRRSDLSLAQIRHWVDVHREVKSGRFPTVDCGSVLDAQGQETGENWLMVSFMLQCGHSGLPARGLLGSPFRDLDDFLDKTYPDERQKPQEQLALPPRSREFLAGATRGPENPQDLSIARLRVWLDVFRKANDGKFPTVKSGEILNVDGSKTGEKWGAIDTLFHCAKRGRPARGLRGSGFESLADFLDKTYPDERKVRNKRKAREVQVSKGGLSVEQIKGWVDVYRSLNQGRFPSQDSGDILNAAGTSTGETWDGINCLFKSGQRGAPARGLKGSGFKSLSDFLDKTYPEERKARAVRSKKQDLSVQQLKAWVDVFREANEGRFPSQESGVILNTDGCPTGETWHGVDSLFRSAQTGLSARGLQNSGFTSLSDFLNKTYPTERARERRAPAARPKSDDINVLLGILE